MARLIAAYACPVWNAGGLQASHLPTLYTFLSHLHLQLKPPAPWVPQVLVPLGAFPLSYKYAVRGAGGGLQMEHGENRTVSLPEGEGWNTITYQG